MAATATASAAPKPLSVTVTTPVKRGRTYDVTFSGFARARARAWVFIDYRRCGTFASEQERAADESQSYRVRGSFAQTSGWKSSRRGEDHACAYLVAAGSGRVLGTASAAYTVS